MRALIDPDGQTPMPLQILRRLWYGRWWRHWSFKKVGLVLGGFAAVLVLAGVATFFIVLHSTTVPIIALSQPLSSSSIVYFEDGKQVGCFCSAGRFPLTEAQVNKSKYVVAAVLAAEDRGFFTEGGISVTGLLRAAKNDLSGNSIQGASTITEQFVKTYYDSGLIGNLSFSTKFKEIFVAIKLAQMKPKMWILTHYLNAIPLGNGANGVQAAAETYFRRNAWQLTDAQAAMLGALIQAPSAYDPQLTPPAQVTVLGNSLLERWVYVLTNMVRDGAISQTRFNQLVPDPSNPGDKANLKNFPKIKPPSPQANWPGFRGYIMALVANELSANYHLNDTVPELGTLGLRIHTTINEHLMRALYSTVAQEKRQMAALGSPMPYYVNISAVLEKPGTGKILAFYGGPGNGVKHCKKLHCKFNTILSGKPVGSSFKPYVLATAVSQGMNERTSVMNSHSPLCIPPDFGPYKLQLSKQVPRSKCDTPVGYWPFNESIENYPMNLSPWEATAVSNDPAFEDLIHRTGVEQVINMAAKLGVSQYSVQGLNSLFGPKGSFPGAVNSALGEGDLTAVDQANTFSVLVSGGKLVPPHIISYVSERGARLQSSLPHRTQAISPAVAADTDNGLSYDTAQTPAGAGTGVPNAVWNRPMIAKTGTLGTGAFAAQAWFVGAIPQYSLSVGMFTDKPNWPDGRPRQILDGLPTIGGITGGYGGAWPATIWHAFMTREFNNLAQQALPTPNYTGFKKWVLALPPKKKHKHCQPQPGQGGGGQGGGGQGGGGQGGGHHHHNFFALASGHGQCQNGGGPDPKNSPSPQPTGPSPQPTVTPSPLPTTPSPSPSPSGSPSPSPSASSAAVAQALAPRRQRVPNRAATMAALSSFAILPDRPSRKPAAVVPSSLV